VRPSHKLCTECIAFGGRSSLISNHEGTSEYCRRKSPLLSCEWQRGIFHDSINCHRMPSVGRPQEEGHLAFLEVKQTTNSVASDNYKPLFRPKRSTPVSLS